LGGSGIGLCILRPDESQGRSEDGKQADDDGTFQGMGFNDDL
jgi:hypothetical protein